MGHTPVREYGTVEGDQKKSSRTIQRLHRRPMIRGLLRGANPGKSDVNIDQKNICKKCAKILCTTMACVVSAAAGH